MNGNIRLADEGSSQSDIKIEGLDIFNSAWGDLNLKVSGTSNGIIQAPLAVSGSQGSI